MLKKTQIGWVFIIVSAFLVGYAWLTTHSYSQMYWLMGIAALLLLLFYRLTIVVTPEKVKFIVGIGLIQKTYLLTDIAYCRPVSYFAFGWGIRFQPGVILFNVSGNKAIELSIFGKSRKVWIGTDAPEELSQYINQMLNKLTEGHSQK